MRHLAQWPWLSALAFGTLIAATDPVSVIATFKEAGFRVVCWCSWRPRVFSTMARLQTPLA
jgi:hypothetical protein